MSESEPTLLRNLTPLTTACYWLNYSERRVQWPFFAFSYPVATGVMLVIDLHITPATNGRMTPSETEGATDEAHRGSSSFTIFDFIHFIRFCVSVNIFLMAKKKHPRPTTPRAEWPISDVIALLALLDHTLEHKELDFQNMVVSHLRKAYTIPQIDRKLASLWNAYGPLESRSTWKGDLFEFGSKCLNDANAGLRDDVLEKVARETKALEDKFRSAEIPTARQLRSASRQSDFPPNRTFDQYTPTREARTSQVRRLRTLSTSLTPSAVKREIEQTESPFENHSPTSKRPRKLPRKVRIDVLKYIS